MDESEVESVAREREREFRRYIRRVHTAYISAISFDGRSTYRMIALDNYMEEIINTYNMCKQALKRINMWTMENKLWLTALFMVECTWNRSITFTVENKILEYETNLYPDIPFTDNRLCYFNIPISENDGLEDAILKAESTGASIYIKIIGNDRWINNLILTSEMDHPAFTRFRKLNLIINLIQSRIPEIRNNLDRGDYNCSRLFEYNEHNIDYKLWKYLGDYLDQNVDRIALLGRCFVKDLCDFALSYDPHPLTRHIESRAISRIRQIMEDNNLVIDSNEENRSINLLNRNIDDKD